MNSYRFTLLTFPFDGLFISLSPPYSFSTLRLASGFRGPRLAVALGLEGSNDGRSLSGVRKGGTGLRPVMMSFTSTSNGKHSAPGLTPFTSHRGHYKPTQPPYGIGIMVLAELAWFIKRRAPTPSRGREQLVYRLHTRHFMVGRRCYLASICPSNESRAWSSAHYSHFPSRELSRTGDIRYLHIVWAANAKCF